METSHYSNSIVDSSDGLEIGMGRRCNGTTYSCQWESNCAGSEAVIGGAGDAELDIENGGSVQSVDATIGQFANSTGGVDLDGDGTWTVQGDLFVGDQGEGVLNSF